jgi:hypothetical protein
MKQNLAKGNLMRSSALKPTAKKAGQFIRLYVPSAKSAFYIDVQYTTSSQKGSIFKSVL